MNPTDLTTSDQELAPLWQGAPARQKAGILLFALSWPLWGFSLLVPLLPLETNTAWWLAAVAIGIAEIIFLIALFLLGRPFLRRLRQWMLAGLRWH